MRCGSCASYVRPASTWRVWSAYRRAACSSGGVAGWEVWNRARVSGRRLPHPPTLAWKAIESR